MATEWASSEFSRRGSDGLRGLDHMEASVRANSEWLPGPSRPGVHAAVRPGGHHLHPIRAWAILAFIIFNVGGAAAVFYFQWRGWA